MATKLGIYNDVLGLVGERSLGSLTENREPRRVLDGYWDQALRFCLEQGFWNFAMRSVQMGADVNVGQTFGFTYAFEKPADWIRTAALSSSDTFNWPLQDYVDETGYWWANVDPIFVRYVSDSALYGLNLTRWPETFSKFVATQIAYDKCERLTQNASKKDDLKRDLRTALANAKAKDAMADPVGRAPTGSWVRSRGGMSRRSSRA